eukprot:Rmarinus@m.25808
MYQAVFILNDGGEPIIECQFDRVVARHLINIFWADVLKQDAPQGLSPHRVYDMQYLTYLQFSDVFFVAVHKDELPADVEEFLARLGEIIEVYLGEVTEQSIKDSFITISVLLSEIIKNGVVVCTEPNTLMELVKPPSMMKKVLNAVTGGSNVKEEMPVSAISNVPWRKMGVKYTSNEVYFVVTEELNCLIDNNGRVLKCSVWGQVSCNCRLSGMPDLLVRLNDSSLIEAAYLHPCIRYNAFESDRVLSFVPPDGDFKLMEYSTHKEVSPPIYLNPQISFNREHGRSGHLSIMVGRRHLVSLKDEKGKDRTLEGLTVTIPLPRAVTSVTLRPNVGTCEFDDVTHIITWTLNKIPDDTSPCLSGDISLSSEAEPPRGAISVSAQYRVEGLTYSGLRIAPGIQVRGESYSPYKGARYRVKAGSFEVRCKPA